MPIEVTCPSCRATLPAPDEFAGKKIRCADCQGIVEVPAARTASDSEVNSQSYGLADERPRKKRRINEEEQATPVAPARRKPKKEWDEDDDNNDNRKRSGSKPGVLTGFSLIWLVVVGALGLSGLVAIVWAVLPIAGKAVAADAPKPIAVAAIVPPVVKPAAAEPMNNFAPVKEQPNVEFVPDPEPAVPPPQRPTGRVPRPNPFNPNPAPPQAVAPNPKQKGLVAKYADRLKTQASSTYASYPVTHLFDGIETSTWFSGTGDTVAARKSPWVEVTFPEDVTIRAMNLLGNRDATYMGYLVHAGRFDFIDAAGKTVSSHDVTATGDKFDMKSDLEADVTGVRTVRFTVTKDLSPNWIALSEWTLE